MSVVFRFARLFLFLVFLSISTSNINAQTNVYECHGGGPCAVDCSDPDIGFTCNTNSVIRGLSASALTVSCNKANECTGLTIECPIADTSDNSLTCVASCDELESCMNLQLYTKNTNQVTLNCGLSESGQSNKNAQICSHVIIDGTYDVANVIPNTQSISLNCLNKDLETGPACFNITTLNIGAISDNTFADNDISMNITCEADQAFVVESYLTCNTLMINSGQSNTISLYAYSKITESFFDFDDPFVANPERSRTVYIGILPPYGEIIHSNVVANNSNTKLDLNITSGVFGWSNLFAPMTKSSPVYIWTAAPSAQMRQNLISGSIHIMSSSGLFQGNHLVASNDGLLAIIASDTTAWIENEVIANAVFDAHLSFGALATGVIRASNVQNHTLVECVGKTPTSACDGLTIFFPTVDASSSAKRATLRCLNYGCYLLNLYAVNGMNDIAFSFNNTINERKNNSDCDCIHDQSCLQEIIVECQSSPAASDYDSIAYMTDRGVCIGDTVCCGDIESESKSMICATGSQSSKLKGGAIAAVVMGLLLCVLIVLFLYWFYRRRTHLKQYEDALRNSPMVDEKPVNKKPTNAKGGGSYGTTASEEYDQL